jgi:hypothetical protein
MPGRREVMRPIRSVILMALPLMVAGTYDASPASAALIDGEEAPQVRRPSILPILPDQMWGLDRLAAQGCPARATILTGRYAHRNGMVSNDLLLREPRSWMPVDNSPGGHVDRRQRRTPATDPDGPKRACR